MAEVERSIYFYAVEMAEGHEWRRADVLQGLADLQGEDQLVSLGNDSYAWARLDRIPTGGEAGRLRFFRERRSNPGIPVSYVPWARIAELASTTATNTRSHAEKRLLLELHRYLKGLMTMQNVTSNEVYVVALGQEPLDWSSLSFKDTVVERDRYYHPVGGKRGGWPRTPPNYLGSRFDGRLQQIRHVEGYEVITRPHDYIPEIIPEADWTEEPHFLYTLGPVIEPPHEVRTGNVYRNQRVWCALDLLLTCKTIREARDKTQERAQ
jgi:hypothetical protein